MKLAQLLQNRWRPLDARWRFAQDVADDNIHSAGVLDDVWAAVAVRFLRAWHRCRSDKARLRLTMQMPAVYEAYRVFTGVDPRLRAELEGRLLAAEPLNAIAAACGISQEAAEAYSNVYFDLQGRLDNVDFVMESTLGPKLHSGLTESDRDMILKLFAYQGGPVVLHKVLNYYKNPVSLRERVDEMDDATLEDFRQRLLVKIAIIAKTLPNTPPRMANFLLADTLASRLDRPPGSISSVRATIKKLLSLLRMADDDDVGLATRRKLSAGRPGAPNSAGQSSLLVEAWRPLTWILPPHTRHLVI